MSGEGTDLPIYQSSKAADGDVIKSPRSSQQQLVPIGQAHNKLYEKGSAMWSPPLSSHPIMSPPDLTPQHPVFSSEDLTRPSPGLRRRPSVPGGSMSSSRNRPRDDHPHPDYHERSRPPRTYRNIAGWESGPQKSYFDDSSRSDLGKDRDLEKGMREPGAAPEWASGEKARRKSTGESIDGYNYDSHKRTGTRGTINLEDLTPEERAIVMRLPWTHWMNSDFKNHFVATVGEFVGTTMFLFFAFAGTQVANIDSNTANTTTGGATGFNIAVELYIAIIFGFSLMVNVWIFFRISGGLFNPAVTLGMVLVGALPIVRAICLFFAQILGGITASAMHVDATWCLYRGYPDGRAGLYHLHVGKGETQGDIHCPVGIGLALFIAEMVGVYYTGGSLNPARSFGPCVVSGSFDKEHWIYWIGPMIGTFIAVFFYKFIKMLEYEMANPGQDGDAKNDPTQNEAKREQILEERQRRYEKRSGTGSLRPGSRTS
ncbi:hypothetical protein EYC84_001390 [Monilinia fructicola]|uniref:Aquaporin n=1 Tax=Monilinia fructicola TaxID=38448 RepID=A0A5M9JRS9_MONFR|nr:hypothetical protein EYC84_001390 [Monilinia fructicola]